MTNKTLTCPIPTNLNPLSPNGFNFTILKLPEVSYFCQQVNLPGIMLGDPMLANPFASAPVPGEHITFDTLNIQFLIDEDMANYKAIWNWIVALGFPQSYTQYTTFTGSTSPQTISELAKNYSDATLSILTANNTVVETVQFVDLFPVTLDSISFMSTSQDVQYLVGNATFRYNYYKFI